MINGMMRFLAGLRLLLARRDLRAVLWRMAGLLIVLLLVLAVGVFWLSSSLAERFIPTGDAWYVDMLAWLVWLFSFILAMAIGMVSYVVLGSVAAAPWLDELCARVEKAEGTRLKAPDSPWWKLVAASIWNSVMPLAVFLPWAAFSLLLLLVPVYGAVTASFVWAYAGLKLLSFEFMDAPASRRGWKWIRRREQFEHNRWFYLGFAGMASLLLAVPVLNLFVLPAAVVALSRYLPADAESEEAGATDNQAG